MTEYVYKRPRALKDTKTHYCPGCGHGIVQRIIAELIDELGIREKTIGVAPVGCSILQYNYMDIDMLDAGHGRTPAVATAIKRVHPDKFVYAYQGDGDLAAIGTAETIHAANRGEKISVIFINNSVYGMTGGQLAPTTLVGQKTSTSLDGRDTETMGVPIRMCELLNTLVAPYSIERVALSGPAGARKVKKAIRNAFQAQLDGKPYTFVEVLSACPIHTKLSPVDALDFVGNTLTEFFPEKVFRKDGEIVNA